MDDTRSGGDDFKTRPAATLAHVAKLANVSKATASMALNNAAGVNEQTRLRVVAAAQSLNYRPHSSARSLRQGSMPVAGLLIDPVHADSSARSSTGLGYDYLIALLRTLSESGVAMVHVGLDHSERVGTLPIDALYVLSLRREVELPQGIAFGVPIVTMGGSHSDPRVRAFIAHDYRAIARQALDHLWERGSRRIAIVRHGALLNPSATASDEYARWCQDHDVSPIVLEGTGDPGQIETIVAAAVVEHQLDGIYSQMMEPGGVVRGVDRAGARIPADVRIVATGGGQIEEMTNPPLTVMSLLGQESGEATGRMLLRGMKTGEWINAVAPFKMIIRGST